MGQPRSERVCWTCRARRKRCDGERPSCGTCSRLGISCAGFGSSAPDWMDGGTQQKAYSRELKGSIKERRRRSSSNKEFNPPIRIPVGPSPHPAISSPTLQESPPLAAFDFSESCFGVSGLDADLSQSLIDCLSQSLALPSGLSVTPADAVEGCARAESSSMDTSNITPSVVSDALFENWPASPVLPIPESDARAEPESPFPCVRATDWSIVAHYLHSVWYRMFPFICCEFEEPAKARLFILLARSSATYHAIMAVAKYSHSRIRKRETYSGGHGSSMKADDWECHYDAAVRKYHDGLAGLDSQTEFHLEEAVVCVANFLLLQHNLGAHVKTPHKSLRELEQAFVKIRDIVPGENVDSQLAACYPDSSSTRDDCVLMQLFSAWLSQWAILHGDCTPLRAPHRSWLAQPAVGDATLLTGTGVCSRRVLDAVCEIHALAYWKRLEVEAESLSAKELGQRVLEIEQKLLAERDPEDSTCGRVLAHCNLSQTREVDSDKSSRRCGYHADMASKTTALFTQAALIYMYTVQSGTRPRVGEIKASVTRAMALLKVCAEAQLLEYVSWPLCIVGCMLGCDTDEDRGARSWLSGVLESLARHSFNTGKQLDMWSLIRRSWCVLDGSSASESDLLELIKELGFEVAQII